MRRTRRRGLTVGLACLLIGGMLVAPAPAQDTAKLGTKTGRRPVKLWPPEQDKKSEKEAGVPIELGGWTYRTTKSPNPRDGVPWELIVTPAGKNADIWHEGTTAWKKLPLQSKSSAPAVVIGASRGGEPGKNPAELAIPVIAIPQAVWQAQMSPELQKAVGIHFHEFVTDDVARILFTVHKVPPDTGKSTGKDAVSLMNESGMPDGITCEVIPVSAGRSMPARGAGGSSAFLSDLAGDCALMAMTAWTAGRAADDVELLDSPPGLLALQDGQPPAGESTPGLSGTRIEATLLTPVVFSIDQTVAVRKDQLDTQQQVDSRGMHEVGHAEMSEDVFLAVLRGPQDWNPQYCTGRRSHLVFYWKRELIGRSWDGYRDGAGKLLTLRTSLAVVPPTRWSMLLPIPPERVTQQQIQAFNDAIVLAAPRFEAADREAQERYHATHGAYDTSGKD